MNINDQGISIIPFGFYPRTPEKHKQLENIFYFILNCLFLPIARSCPRVSWQGIVVTCLDTSHVFLLTLSTCPGKWNLSRLLLEHFMYAFSAGNCLLFQILQESYLPLTISSFLKAKLMNWSPSFLSPVSQSSLFLSWSHFNLCSP